jgi:hypothetical protein
LPASEYNSRAGPGAQRDICRAIVDRKVRIRLLAAKAEIPDAKWSGPAVCSHVAIPQDLSPRDFDWRKSLPKRKWQHGDRPFEQVHLTLIEFFSEDVTLVLCAGGGIPERSTKGSHARRLDRAEGLDATPSIVDAAGPGTGEGALSASPWCNPRCGCPSAWPLAPTRSRAGFAFPPPVGRDRRSCLSAVPRLSDSR